jgi:hypothetical protein
MNPYRNKMDLEPRVVKVDSEEHLKAQVAELQKQGRRVIECNVFENGIIGKLAFWVPPDDKVESWTPQDADAVWLTWQKYGRLLEPDKIHVKDGAKLFEMYNEHKEHQITAYTNAQTRHAGFVCFCKAHTEGKALVFFVSLTDMKGVPPELLAAFEQPAQVVDPKSRE